MARRSTLWRSLDELEPGAIEAFIEAEFPALHEMGRMSRRDLMRLMGASLALAGIAGCKSPTAAPAGVRGGAGGESVFVATTLELDGYGRGARIRVENGRPVKVEGHPLHPASLGATDPIMQGELLGLYDPDRSSAPWSGGAPRHWAQLRRWLASQRSAMAAERGVGTHVLIGATSSPTAAGLIERIRARLPGIRFHTYSPVTDLFDPAPERVHDFTAADAVLSLGGDILGPGPAQVRHARDWTSRKRSGGERPLLIVAEPSPTLTGARADERLALAPHEIDALAWSLLDGDGGRIGAALAAAASSLVVADAGRAAFADALNARLGATAVRRIAPVRLAAGAGIEPIADLHAAMVAGAVRRLVVIDCNPAYDAPAAEAFEDQMTRVPQSLHLGLHRDETGRACRWHVPQHHALERWGDLRAFDGTVSLQQPATAPLVPGLSPIELLALLAGERPDGRALVRRQWAGLDEAAFAAAFESGNVPAVEPGPAAAGPPPLPPRRAGPGPRLALTFRPDARLWDGRHANNAWLQELPDPLTKLVWGNAALLSPATAGRLGLEDGDLVEIARGGAAVSTPVKVMPGQADDTATLTLGYGRPHAGRVGAGLGVDAYPLRGRAGEVSLRKLAGRGRLIATERHQPTAEAMPVRTVAPGERLPPEPEQASFYPRFASPEQAWGMAIDLDACIGCGACTIACQAENNIPVVGPDEVERGREMHWIRVDRYFEGPPEDPAVHFQPVPCMHCEEAPCEVVCPVGATVHSSDGLNQMVYNRCIGTRTCSNNCPWKVRRFNWFDYRDRPPPTPDGARNPDVLVRGRGVMEKCTYCVHRIQSARAETTVEGRELQGDEVRTACQQACPSEAILFGDLNDPESAVARARRSGRNYALLGGLGTRPRTTYLARVGRRRRP